jgi:hypothetical protein
MLFSAWRSANAAAAESNELLAAARSMIGWFQALLENVQQIVATERRHQLAVRLRILNSGLAHLSAEKYDLLEVLRSQLPGPPHDFEARAGEVTEAIRRLREQVIDVTAELTEHYQIGGNECAHQLEVALRDRKAWVNNIGSVDLMMTISNGENAIHGLDLASRALGRLIAALDPPSIF